MFIVGIEALPTLQGASLAPLLACSCSSIDGNDRWEKNHCANSSLQAGLSAWRTKLQEPGGRPTTPSFPSMIALDHCRRYALNLAEWHVVHVTVTSHPGGHDPNGDDEMVSIERTATIEFFIRGCTCRLQQPSPTSSFLSKLPWCRWKVGWD